MANQDLILQLKQTHENLKTINQERLLRPALGEESLQQQSGFPEKLDSIFKKVKFALEYGSTVSNEAFGAARNYFEQIRNVLDQQSRRNNTEYVTAKAGFSNTLDSFLNQLYTVWPNFIASAVEARGLLQDEGIRNEYQKSVGQMQTAAEEALRLVREESSKTISEARQLAKEIEGRARQTAARISVKEAQDEFQDAQAGLDTRVKVWGVLSSLSVLVFVGVAVYLARSHPRQDMKWDVIYFAAIRITILTAVGAVATFCLRILRAQMHMSQHNQHRQRVANSMTAFVEAAVTPEQRDLILGQLVAAVVDFGTSGLLPKEDDVVYSPKMTIDTISRTISQPSTK